MLIPTPTPTLTRGLAMGSMEPIPNRGKTVALRRKSSRNSRESLQS
jgi:hypothetical protein